MTATADPLLPDTRRQAARDAAIATLVGLILFGVNADFLIRGDAATYANYVLLGRYDDLTLHLGYYAVLAAAHHTIGTLLGLPLHETMTWLNVACGAASLGVAYLLALELLAHDRAQAACATIVFALCGRVLMNATTSEIYMLQCLLLLAAFLLYARDRAALAGAAAGAALLVTPLSAFAFLYFPALDLARDGRVRWRRFGAAFAGGVVVYLPYLLVHGDELLHGRRGLLMNQRGWPFTPSALVTNFPKYQFKHYTAMLVLLVPAAALLGRRRDLLLVTAAVCLPHAYIVAKLVSEDNVFLLPTDFFFALWLAVGWAALRRRAGRIAAWAPVGAHAALLVAAGVLFGGDRNRDYGPRLRELATTHLADGDTLLISDWDVGIVLTYFGRERATDLLEREPLYRQVYDLTNRAQLPAPALDGRRVLLIDPWEPSPLGRLLRPASSVARLAEAHSIRAQAERVLGLACRPLRTDPHPTYECTPAGAGPS